MITSEELDKIEAEAIYNRQTFRNDPYASKTNEMVLTLVKAIRQLNGWKKK